jgi:REP element-mobilizing transposase RayT
MPRVLRTQLPDGLFHIATRAVERTPAFFDDVDRIGFLRLLGECVRRFDWDMYAYCLMTTHYHLVLRAAQDALSEGMQRLNGLHARRVNLRIGRRGHLFGARFSSWTIESDEYAAAACRYVLLNPVRAGLCERPRTGAGAAAATENRSKTEHLFDRPTTAKLDCSWLLQTSWSSTAPASTTSKTSPSGCRGTR